MRSASYLPDLLRIARRAVPFTSSDGQAFIRLHEPSSDGFYILPVRSPACRHWFLHQFFCDYDSVPTAQAFGAFLDHLEAEAQHSVDNQYLAVWRRVGARGSDTVPREILLDLADPTRQFVSISAEGWDLCAGENALFLTSRSTVPLPAPAHSDPGPALAILRSCLNLPDRASWICCLAWLLAALRPSGPFPFLILTGPPSSGKSFAARILRTLIDPSTAPLTPIPNTVRDLVAAARQNWILAFDHISTLAPQIPDAVCRLSNGLGAALCETPRSEPEPLLQYYRRPVIFTATPRWTPPPELAERSLTVCLPSLPAVSRRPETELIALIRQSFPAILGALCSAVSTALVRLPALPVLHGRLPDALAWTLAASPALTCPGEEAFTEDEIRDAFSAPITRTLAQSVRALLVGQPQWSGTASQLFELLSPLDSCCSPKVLSEQLRAAAPALAARRIKIAFRRSNGVRHIDLSLKRSAALAENNPTDASQSSQPNESQDLLAA